MPLYTAAPKPALVDAVRIPGVGQIADLSPMQREDIARKLDDAADTIKDRVIWQTVRNALTEVRGDALRDAWRVLRDLSLAVRTYTPPAPQPVAPAFKFGDRVTTHSGQLAIVLAGPNEDGRVRVAYAEDGHMSLLTASSLRRSPGPAPL